MELIPYTGRSQRHDKRRKNEVVPKVSFIQLIKLNSAEWQFLVVGGIASVMHGANFPLWGLFFGDFFGIMSNGDDDVVRSEVLKISMIFVGIGLMAGLGNMLQTYMFTTAGVKMTTRLRKRAFGTIVGQDIAYFDDERNSVGALCSRLASDCSNVQGVSYEAEKIISVFEFKIHCSILLDTLAEF